MSMEKKEDRRVRYTKRAIKESFLKLLEEKPVEKISVTEICRDADINRGTFYSHYNDPFDLKDKLVYELVDAMKKRMIESGSNRIKCIDTLNILLEEKDLCRIFAGENGDIEALSKIIRTQTGTYIDSEYGKILSDMTEVRRTAVERMAVAAITNTVKVWIDSGMQTSPDRVADTMCTFIAGGVNAFADKKND